MDEYQLIYLVAETHQPDAMSQQVPVETMRPVWARLESVTRAEWVSAGQQGLNPQIKAVTAYVNYGGEQIVQIGEEDTAKRYGVYRTFRAVDSDEIELYLEYKVGV